MKNTNRTMFLALSFITSSLASCVQAQDWPQWLGSNRDARATVFKAPKTWPKELAQKWKVTVGNGVATPALVGDKLYVFSREEGNEITRCLEAATGKELWQEKYDSLGATGPASGYSGPRSSPAVANGKVVTLGVRGIISCLDAATGKKLWRKDDFKAWPRFHPSSSPIIVDGLCIAQLGGQDNGAIVAYDLVTGADAPTAIFASQNLVTIGAIRGLRRAARQHTVAIVGFDDFMLADLLQPAVTVVAQDPVAMGRIAAEVLFQRLDGDTAPTMRRIVDTRLIPRGSGEIRPPVEA